jgi:hypothetical protein
MSIKKPKISWRWSIAKEDVVLAVAVLFVVAVGGPLFKRFFTSDAYTFPEQWGQMGDFVGGFANPVVALAALFLLWLSIKIQRHELREAHESLRRQAESASASVEIAGYTAAINAAVAQVEIHQTHITYLMTQIHSGQIGAGILGMTGDGYSRQEAFTKITELHAKVSVLMEEQDYFSKRLKLTLRAMGHSQID